MQDGIFFSFSKAIKLLVTLDREVWQIIFNSLYISLLSVIFSSLISIFLAFIIHFKKFKLKKILIIIINTLMAVPTIGIGLLVYMFISKNGPLGSLDLLFTPVAIIIGQTLLCLPLMLSYLLSGFAKIDQRLSETLITLGAKGLQFIYYFIKETKIIIISAILAAFGRAIGEIGISMMLGGNIRWQTRTITTSIALETSKGEFYHALALGIVLIIIALGVNIIIQFFLRKNPT
jgi:tungstate transport system permease protein